MFPWLPVGKRIVMFPWLLNPNQNSKCRDIRINKSAQWRHDNYAGCSWHWSLNSASFGHITLSKRYSLKVKRLEKSVGALEMPNAQIMRKWQINHPELASPHQSWELEPPFHEGLFTDVFLCIQLLHTGANKLHSCTEFASVKTDCI